MRALALLAVVLVAGCGGSSAVTELTVTVWSQGRDGPSNAWTLRCPGDPRCGRLKAELFDPVPPDSACTQIYGGPQQARVRGTLRGRRIDARFDRTNGCEIARWEHAAFLFRS